MRITHRAQPAAIAITAVAIVGSLIPAATAANAAAAKPKVHYTNSTRVKADGPQCAIHWNYPHAGVTDHAWPAGPSTPSKIVGVRYTAGGYALVRDGGRQRAHTAPWWGWINTTCLLDPYARKFPRVAHPRDLANRPDPDSYAPRLPSHHATRGNNSVIYIDITPKPGHRKGRVRVGSTGTLRNAPQKYVTGNLAAGWVFQITRAHCRRLDGQPFKPSQWVFGYSANAHRWGWIQARHLPDCTNA